jgi:hypothetical protein
MSLEKVLDRDMKNVIKHDNLQDLKLVKDQHNNNHIVPSYETDLIIQNDEKIVEFDLTRLTETGWNYNKHQTREIGRASCRERV